MRMIEHSGEQLQWCVLKSTSAFLGTVEPGRAVPPGWETASWGPTGERAGCSDTGLSGIKTFYNVCFYWRAGKEGASWKAVS